MTLPFIAAIISVVVMLIVAVAVALWPRRQAVGYGIVGWNHSKGEPEYGIYYSDGSHD